jgi:hypothetical protein
LSLQLKKNLKALVETISCRRATLLNMTEKVLALPRGVDKLDSESWTFRSPLSHKLMRAGFKINLVVSTDGQSRTSSLNVSLNVLFAHVEHEIMTGNSLRAIVSEILSTNAVPILPKL